MLKFSYIFKKCALNEKLVKNMFTKVHGKFTKPLRNFDKTCMRRVSKKRRENQKNFVIFANSKLFEQKN